MITNRQIRSARILLGWSRAQTLLKAGVSMYVLGRLEREGPRGASDKALFKLVGCYEAAGCRFLDDCGVTVQRDRAHDSHRTKGPNRPQHSQSR
jgi:hypothetical protein